MESFSLIEYTFEDFKNSVSKQKQLESLTPVTPFSAKEMTKENTRQRIERSLGSYRVFDKTYFPPAMYEFYSPPNKMIEDIVNAVRIPGIHLFIGPRKHGKTMTGKKLLLYSPIAALHNITGVYAETLNKSAAVLKDLYTLCQINGRLSYDYNLNFIEANSDSLSFRCNYRTEFNPPPDKTTSDMHQPRFIASFSEGRSVKGFTRLFGRPSLLLADDIETLESSFSARAVELRFQKLSEAYHSLNDNGSMIILANDFHVLSVVHRIRLLNEKGLLPGHWYVYVYKAYNHSKSALQKKGVLWNARFKVKTENQLKAILKPASESDWQANYQQNPVPPEGDFFNRKHYAEYQALPDDVRGVIYCDPNLSKKSMGNTTAIVPLLYSPSADVYYLPETVCRSFADSNILLGEVFRMWNSLKVNGTRAISAIAFDGNVTQESTWTQHVKNYCRLNSTAFPLIEYKRYRVNELAKNLQAVYTEGRLKFAGGFSLNEDGERFLAQFFSFTGEKNGSEDDAPDALICAFEFIHERKLIRQNTQPFKVFKDYYSL